MFITAKKNDQNANSIPGPIHVVKTKEVEYFHEPQKKIHTRHSLSLNRTLSCPQTHHARADNLFAEETAKGAS